jgi:hypothetical protein
MNAQISYYDVSSVPDGSGGKEHVESTCNSPFQASVKTDTKQGIVNSVVNYDLLYFPKNSVVSVRWDSSQLSSVATNGMGDASGSLTIPATPMGTHKIRWTSGQFSASSTFTVSPRIKVTPASVVRGQTVDVSLRGFAAKEVVRIRWKKGSSWVEVARVTTSNTGSANIKVVVPSFASSGPASVRGDGTYGRAQTNAVTVSGATKGASTSTPTPTPTKTPIKTATPAPTETVTPTVPPATPTATKVPTEIPSVVPTESPTTVPVDPTEPAAETPTPTESTIDVADPDSGSDLTPEPTVEPDYDAASNA